MASRRNPPKSALVPLLLLGVGAYALYAAKKQPAPVNGMGSWLSKAVHKVKKVADKVAAPVKNVVSKVPVVNKVAGTVASTVKQFGNDVKSGANPLQAAVGVNMSLINKVTGKKVRKVMKGKATPAPALGPGEVYEYQDENGNVITEAEYNRRQALYEQYAACSAKGWNWDGASCNQPITSATQPATSNPTSYSDSSSGGGGGGGGGGSSYDESSSILPPAGSTPTPTSVDQAAEAADPAAAAPSGINPLVAVATFAAVPLLLGLTGGK